MRSSGIPAAVSSRDLLEVLWKRAYPKKEASWTPFHGPEMPGEVCGCKDCVLERGLLLQELKERMQKEECPENLYRVKELRGVEECSEKTPERLLLAPATMATEEPMGTGANLQMEPIASPEAREIYKQQLASPEAREIYKQQLPEILAGVMRVYKELRRPFPQIEEELVVPLCTEDERREIRLKRLYGDGWKPEE